MKKESKFLKLYSYIYIVFAVFSAVTAVLCLTSTEYAEKAIGKFDTISTQVPLTTLTFVYYLAEGLFYLWFAWLIKRVATGRSRGIFVSVLLILSIAAGVVTLVQRFTPEGLLSVCADSLGLLMIINAGGKNKEK